MEFKKNGELLLVEENKKECRGKWNVPAVIVENESLIEGAKREIYEEMDCKVEITGITKIIEENIKVDGEEISNVKWFEEIINMKDKLRAECFLSTLKNKIDNKIQPLDIIKTIWE